MEQTKQILSQVLSLTVFQLLLFPLRNKKGPLLYLAKLANVFLGLDHYGLQICLNGLSDFALMLFLILIFCFNIRPERSMPCISRKLLQYTPEALDFSIFPVRFH